jgi:hypothetical protein
MESDPFDFDFTDSEPTDKISSRRRDFALRRLYRPNE